MENCRVYVFKQIELIDQVLYQWFRLGDDHEDHIVPDIILSEDEHWQRVNAD